MADRAPPTLGRLQRLGVKRVRFVCLYCHHTAELDVWEIIRTVGMGRHLHSLRFECNGCGKHVSNSVCCRRLRTIGLLWKIVGRDSQNQTSTAPTRPDNIGRAWRPTA